MPQNKNKLIDLFVGNISIAITHKILIEAVKDKSKEMALLKMFLIFKNLGSAIK